MSVRTTDKMTDAELICVLLDKGVVDKECHSLADLIAQYGPASGILRTSVDDRRQAQVEAAIEYGRRVILKERTAKTPFIDGPDEVYELMAPILQGLEQEHFYCLCLDTRKHLKKMIEVSVGTLDASIVHPRDLFIEAIKVSASSIVMVHHHPSGDSHPSSADLRLTRRMIEAGGILGIEMVDHVIIGGGGLDKYTSFAEDGLL